ncbi:energy-coupling factor transporter transmembrane protein EcfT [Salinibacterium sp. SYSU T00001]|uniref:energy-coupling factor transporter transmembrane component T family protein n=1 Tax=Homoserinimonas sedimenticola TaxID=2986805 RepID=UPI00223584C9|nr:energy-coupling factor transporter transmembrane component T [Salinibacterium sedimenticola]MCW4384232.1 energy-coupling factor transporter transmembrane protein EcfT [Salinibacterium sedimenticola]
MSVTLERRTSAISGVNPVAKLATALLVAGVLVLSIDWVSATVALGLELVLFAFAGISARTFWLRTLPVWVMAPLAGVTIALYGEASGRTHLEWLFVHVTDGSLTLAIATVLRILAIGLPAVVLFITIDPTDLADGLAQVAKLPSRFVLGGLAGLRLVGLLIEDWRSIELARRARGVADRGRLRRLPGQAFALLVIAIRRGSKLATAMEARGFGGDTERSWARESHFGGRDVALILVGAGIAAAAVTVAVATGDWNVIWARS